MPAICGHHSEPARKGRRIRAARRSITRGQHPVEPAAALENQLAFPFERQTQLETDAEMLAVGTCAWIQGALDQTVRRQNNLATGEGSGGHRPFGHQPQIIDPEAGESELVELATACFTSVGSGSGRCRIRREGIALAEQAPEHSPDCPKNATCLSLSHLLFLASDSGRARHWVSEDQLPPLAREYSILGPLRNMLGRRRTAGSLG